jgi:hypothetical protein
LDDLDPFTVEDGLEGAAELRVAVVDQEARPWAAVIEIHQQLRACWIIHAVSGLVVRATYSTRRVPIEMKNSTYKRRSQTVST